MKNKREKKKSYYVELFDALHELLISLNNTHE